MKIVSKSKKWSKQFKCEDCGSVIEVEEKDLTVGNYAVGWGGETWEPEVEFECPICHSYVQVTGKIPKGIQSRKMDEALKAYRERNRKQEKDQS